MAIAELFVKLGFIAETSDLDKVEKQITVASGAATKLALGLAVVDTAMVVPMERMLGVVVGFQKFRIETGLSTDELQRLQYAARLANVSGEEVAGALKTIQDAQAAIKLGEGNIAPWQLLGIDPRQDPFKVLEEIHQRIQNLDPGVARHITAQIGISDDIFQFLRRSNLELDQIRDKLLVTQREEQDMAALNHQWQAFTYNLERAALKLSVVLAPAFERLLPVIERLLDRGSRFAEWAAGGSAEAAKFRNAITYLAEGLLVLGPILATLIGLFSAFKVVLVAGEIVKDVAAITASFGLLGVTIAAVAFDLAEIIRLIKIVDDIGKADAIANDAGKKAESSEQRLGQLMRDKNYTPRTEREREIKEGKYLTDDDQRYGEPAIGRQTAIAHVAAAITAPKPAVTLTSPAPGSAPEPAPAPGSAAAGAATAPGKGPVNITHNVTINVNGAGDPKAVADEIDRRLADSKRKEYSGVSDQIAINSQGF